MKEKVEESLYSKMQPSKVSSEDGKLTAILTAENSKLYSDHLKGKPFKVYFFHDDSWLDEYYYASIEEAHQSMRKYVNT